MRIMSLNVNRFSGMNDRDSTNKFTKLDECPKANEIIAFVKGFLFGNPDGLVLLYEVPYCEGYREWYERLLYKEFRCQFPAENYVCEVPGKKAYSCTIAIWNRKDCAEKVWTRQDDFSDFRKGNGDYRNYRNKFIELTIERGGSTLRVLGVHAPCEKSCEKPSKKPEFEVDISEAGDLETLRDVEEAEIDEKTRKVKLKGDKDVYNFFKSLKQYAVAVQDKKEPFIIVGDLNVHKEKSSIYLAQIHEIVNSGYSDEIADKKIATYFLEKNGEWEGTVIDHALVSPVLQDRVTVQVVPREILELSDHAAIIVDVQIEP